MTIREAVELVLISSQLETKNGEIFILEMGKPFYIKDLARRMINLLGEKENEIKIIYTGLRKGEKLSEQLFFNEERITNTNVEGIFSTTDKIYNVDTSDYNSLVSYIQKNETKKAINKFKKMLPEYKVDVKN
jgi:O-antigen biosynthesis protein WbqV